MLEYIILNIKKKLILKLLYFAVLYGYIGLVLTGSTAEVEVGKAVEMVAR